MSASMTAGIRRRITDTEAYLCSQAVPWLTRTSRGKITYARETPEHRDSIRRLKVAIEALEDGDGKTAYQAKKIGQQIETNEIVDPRMAGKMI